MAAPPPYLAGKKARKSRPPGMRRNSALSTNWNICCISCPT